MTMGLEQMSLRRLIPEDRVQGGRAVIPTATLDGRDSKKEI
jgi:hypothetical protein